MSRAANLVVALALSFAGGGCGGAVFSTPESDGHAAAPPADAAAPSPDAADTPVLDAPEAGPISVLPPLQVDAGQSPCVVAGGTCLELVACNGRLVSLACGWSAGCCMPDFDAGIEH